MNGRSLQDLRDDARAAAARGDAERARHALLGALGDTKVREEEYVSAARELREILVNIGDFRGALTLDWYTGNDRGQRDLVGRVPPIDRARTMLAWADRAEDPGRKQSLYANAADEYESAGLVAQAAIARERGGDLYRARALWSRLAQLLTGSGGDLYAAGLARFNLARTSMRTGETTAAREAVVAAVHLLEEAADRYETVGQRERAFDCYQVLIAVGRESGEFEHVLEGFVNVIRILREDHLRYYALQSYEEALAAAEKQREVAAAATLAREMSAYARKEGLPAVANFATLAQARLWQEVADAALTRGSPPSIAENALLAAVIALSEVGQYNRVGHVYDKLAVLEIEQARRKHYATARKRYVDAAETRIESQPLPAHLRHEVGFPDVWHVDLVEWEQRGSAAEATGDVILDPTAWAEVTRRRALLARLTALAIEAQEHAAPMLGAHAQLYVTLAEQLALVELYTILSPLERLFRKPEPQVRVAVVKALARFLYKRTFITLRDALADPDPNVVQEAAKALEDLRFPHAFDPLARIYRESQSTSVRASAIRALARIDTLEAAELLLSIIDHDGREEQKAAVEALKKARGMKFVDVAKNALPGLSEASKTAVREILRSRGVG
ncbi:MAG: HEAT repeat domain-containing protein [Polyangiaceae bacterium]|nr:HEAT repeat domain-containing protein [Polyangiaceae bacterium]